MITRCIRTKRREPGHGKLYGGLDHCAYNIALALRGERERKPQKACDCFHLGYA